MTTQKTPAPAHADDITGQSLRRHLEVLQGEGKLQRFGKRVNVDTNISALAYQTYVQQRKACLFSNIDGFPGWEVASQLVMDRDMWALALGVPETDVVPTLAERLAHPIAPRIVNDAPVQEVVELDEAVDLMSIPAMWTSENDPGRYIASGMCIIKDPETGIRNMSVHRAQVLGRNTTGYYMLPRQAMRIHQMHQKLGRPMQAAMVIGGHPLIMFASAFVAPFGMDELAVAGGLLRQPVRLVKCKTIDVEVPADAELVLEGEILPEEIAGEGPFGEVTGTYSKRGTAPVFRVKAITRRRKPVFYAMSCGMAPSDAHSITCAVVEAKLWDHLKGVDGGLLDIRDVRSPGGMSPLMVALRMHARYPGQTRTALMAAAASPYLHPKFLASVDPDVDAGDAWAILRALVSRMDPMQGITRIDKTRVFTLDNSSPLDPGQGPMHRTGTKLLLDACLPTTLSDAERARHTWNPHPHPMQRADWAQALGLAEHGLPLTLRDRLDHSNATSTTSVAAIDTQHFTACSIDAIGLSHTEPNVGVMLMGTEKNSAMYLARVIRQDNGWCIALDTPRLAAASQPGARVQVLLGASPASLFAAACGSLGMHADWHTVGAIAEHPTCAQQATGVLHATLGEISANTSVLPTLSGFAGAALFTVGLNIQTAHGKTGHAIDVTSLICVANEALTARHLRNIEGGLDLRDVHCPPACGGLLTVLQLAPRVSGQAKTALMAALSGSSTLARSAIAIDPDVSATDPAELIWAFASRTHAPHDLSVIPAASCMPSDANVCSVAPGAAQSAKWLCDCTVPLGNEQGEGAESFARATPKNNIKVKLADFLE